MSKKKIDKPIPTDWAKFSDEQKFDYLMDLYLYNNGEDTKALKHYGKSMTLNQAKEHIQRRLLLMTMGHDVKCNCPVCYKPQGYQTKNLSDGTIEFAWVLYNLSMEIAEQSSAGVDYLLDNNMMPSFPYYEDDKLTGRKGIIKLIYDYTSKNNPSGKGRKPTGYGILKHWGLIMEDDKNGGNHRPTRKAYDFFSNGIVLPKTIWIYNDAVIGESDTKYTWDDVKLFDYKTRLLFRTTYY